LAADTSASEYLSFRPQTCGRHTIFGVAQAEGFPATIGKVYAFVTIDAVSSVQSLIEATKKAKLPEETQEGLVETLKAAGRFFRVGHEQAGDEMISQYIRRLSKQNKRERIDPSIANRLIGQAQPIVTCIADSLRHDQEGEDLVQAKTPAPQ
ncbi:MAG: hypothetical protein JOY85_04415, partial [Acidobacteriaceae bacterium]|nr:hypothetical protein [Acidobacteriaceae bacterium]